MSTGRILQLIHRGAFPGEEHSVNATLSQVSVGDAAVVRRVRGTSEIRRRLLDMGIVPGVSIEMTRVSPLGDPIEVRVRR